jgi:O-antigen/teichoic acid export membrane protein
MTKHQNDAALILLGAVVLNILLNLILVPSFGMEGAAIATATSTAAWNLAMVVRVKQLLGVRTLPF